MSHRHLVLYHRDPDGFAAAWAAWRYLGTSADYRSVNYGEPMPDLADYQNLYILDFCYSLDDLESAHHFLQRLDGTITVIDHHQTNAERLEALSDRIVVIHDTSKCGAVLTWEHFFSEVVPLALLYVQDRDLWTMKLPHTKAFHYGVGHLDITTVESFPRFSELVKDLDNTIVAGSWIQGWVENQVEIGAKCARKKRVAWLKQPDDVVSWGRKAWVVNFVGPWISDLGHRLYGDPDDGPNIAIIWSQHKQGNYKVSLYSPGVPDVSVYAKAMGGGGHPGTAGFLWDGPIEELWSAAHGSWAQQPFSGVMQIETNEAWKCDMCGQESLYLHDTGWEAYPYVCSECWGSQET